MTNEDILQCIGNLLSLILKVLKLQLYSLRHIVKKLMTFMEKIIQFGIIEGVRWHEKLRMQWINTIKKAMRQSLCELMKKVKE